MTAQSPPTKPERIYYSPSTGLAGTNSREGDIPYVPADAVPQWRPIETAPRNGERVLLWAPHMTNRVRLGYYGPYGWHIERVGVQSVSHWMPLPEPPT